VKGFYLPDENHPATSVEYLVNIAEDRAWRIERSKVKLGFIYKSRPKSELYKLLQTLIPKDKLLGFNDVPPDDEWMINCIFTFAPTHSVFESDYPDLPQRMITKELAVNVKVYKGKNNGLFNKLRKESLDITIDTNKKRLEKKIKQLNRIEHEIVLKRRKLQDYRYQDIQIDLAMEEEKKLEREQVDYLDPVYADQDTFLNLFYKGS